MARDQLWYVPAGTYTAKIIKVDPSVSKSGEWSMVNVRFVVLEGDEEGAMFHHRFFVHSTKGNVHAKAGLESIKRLTKAALSIETDDYVQMLDCKVIVSVKLEDAKPRDDGGFWNPSNVLTDIRSYADRNKSTVPSMAVKKKDVYVPKESELISDELPF